MNWIDRLERKYQRFSVKNLTKYIVIGTAFVFILSLFKEFKSIDQILNLDSYLVLKGQIWRLITFIFVPPAIGFWIIPALYVFYVFGSSLERFWGSFRFNLYYLIGVLSAILAAFLGGKVTSEFLTMSIFLAFAYLYPNYKLLFFFVLPLKVKYLAWFDIVLTVISIIFRPESRITAALSFASFFVFFGRDIYFNWISPRIKAAAKRRKRRKFKVITSQVKPSQMVYTCCICGRTSKEHPELKFSYCYKCGSDVEYCQDHLTNHEHIIRY